MNDPKRLSLFTDGRLFYGWIVVGGCFCMSIVSGAFVYARGVFLPEMADDFGGSRLDVTLAFTIAQAVGALCSPFIGVALDRWHPRIVLLTGAAMITVGYFLTAWVSTLLGLYAIFGLLFGAGWRGISSFSTSRVLVRWFNRWRGIALSIDVAGASVAGIFVPLVAVWMMASFGWRMGFAAFGVFTLSIVIPLVLFVIKSNPAEVGQYPDGEPPGPESDPSAPDAIVDERLSWKTADFLRVPAFWGVVVVFSAMVCVFNGVNMHLFGHMKAIGFLDERAAIVLTAMGTCIVAGKPILGLLADWRGPKTAVLASLVGQTIGLGIFALDEISFPVMVAAAMTYGLGMSGMAPLQSVAVAAVFGPNTYGRVNGLMQPFMLPVALLASPVAAWIYDQSGNYTAAFMIFFVLMVIALPVAAVLRLTERQVTVEAKT